MIVLKPDDADVGTRLDSFVAKNINEVSRGYIQKLCEKGKILVNKSVEKTKYKVRPSDIIEILIDLADLKNIPDINLDVIYEDDDCLVISKPEGVLTHSKGAFNPEATVATFIIPSLKDMDGERAGIVHRLDRATSGVMICAKTMEALTWLQKQFSQRRVKKTYYAVISGHMSPTQAIIDMPIERHPRNPKIFRASPGGKPAQTEYTVVLSSPNYELVELKPKTGRTHQLRVHLSHLKHPIVGDMMYDGENSDRMYLHAERLELTLPSRERKVFEVPLPASFKKILEDDGQSVTKSKD